MDGSKDYYDTDYLKVTANCCFEGYEVPVEVDMVLKVGDRLGDALIIKINRSSLSFDFYADLIINS